MVFIDPTAPADEKFRMFIAYGASGPGLHIFSSPDGIQWKLTHKGVVTARPQPTGHHLDSQNVLFWDDGIKKYVFYGRKNQNTPASQGRSIARGESSDLKSFPVVQDMPVVIGPDRFDDYYKQGPVVDYYMPAASKYPWADSIYVMFPTAYYHFIGGGILPEFKDKIPVNAGPLDTQFAASRDGIVWQRYDRRPFVPLGMKGEFDWANTRTVYGIVPSVDGHYIYMYYRGGDWLHGWDRNESNKKLLTDAGLGADKNIAVLSRIQMRMDGFVSVRGAYTGGEFTTTQVKFSGNKLVLNIDTSATGIASVEIVDADGLVVDGFGQTDCDMIHTCKRHQSRGVVEGQERFEQAGRQADPAAVLPAERGSLRVPVRQVTEGRSGLRTAAAARGAVIDGHGRGESAQGALEDAQAVGDGHAIVGDGDAGLAAAGDPREHLAAVGHTRTAVDDQPVRLQIRGEVGGPAR